MDHVTPILSNPNAKFGKSFKHGTPLLRIYNVELGTVFGKYHHTTLKAPFAE